MAEADVDIEMSENRAGESQAKLGRASHASVARSLRASGESFGTEEPMEQQSRRTNSPPPPGASQHLMPLGFLVLAVALVALVVYLLGGSGSTTTTDKEGTDLANQLCKEQKENSEMFSDREIGDQVRQLCATSGNIGGNIVFGHVPAGAPPGELLKAQGPLEHGLVLRELTEAQREFWSDNFAVNPPKEESYLVPLLATFSFGGSLWGVEPNQYLDDDQTAQSDSYEMGDQEHSKLSRAYPGGISISQEHWEKMAIKLCEDVTNLRKVGSIGYKISATVYAEPQGDELARQDAMNSRGKRVVRAHDWKGDSKPLGGLLLNGVTDYLQKGTDTEANLYACRLFLTATTKMFTPCRWPRGAKSPEGTLGETPCVTDFSPFFEKALDGDVPSKDLDGVCLGIENSQSGVVDLRGFLPKLLQLVFEQLDRGSDSDCVKTGVGRFRAPEHCVKSFTRGGEEYQGCAYNVVHYKDLNPPVCSWTAKLDDTSWDGPWSYCVMCQSNPPPVYPPIEPTPIEGDDQKGEDHDDEPEPPTPEGILSKAFCEEASRTKVAGKTFGQLQQLCEKTGNNFRMMSFPASRRADLGNKGKIMYLVNAQGPLKKGVFFYKLRDNEQAVWMDKFNKKPPHVESYLVPQLAFFDANAGEQWGVMPHTELDSSELGLSKRYSVDGAGLDENAEWKSEYPNTGLQISQEHWLKVITVLVLDLEQLKSAESPPSYSMDVSVYTDAPAEDAFKKNSVGMHALRAYDKGRGSTVGVLLGGIVDYLQEPAAGAGAGVERSVYACKVMLSLTTELLSPCRWPVGAEQPDDDACVDDFYLAFREALPDSSIPKRGAPNFLTELCKVIDEESSLGYVHGKLTQFVDEKLNGKQECPANGYRAPEHCKPKWTFKNKPYSGCAEWTEDVQRFDDFPARWCSWKETLDDDEDWDSAWSFCVKCGEEALLVA